FSQDQKRPISRPADKRRTTRFLLAIWLYGGLWDEWRVGLCLFVCFSERVCQVSQQIKGGRKAVRSSRFVLLGPLGRRQIIPRQGGEMEKVWLRSYRYGKCFPPDRGGCRISPRGYWDNRGAGRRKNKNLF